MFEALRSNLDVSLMAGWEKEDSLLLYEKPNVLYALSLSNNSLKTVGNYPNVEDIKVVGDYAFLRQRGGNLSQISVVDLKTMKTVHVLEGQFTDLVFAWRTDP